MNVDEQNDRNRGSLWLLLGLILLVAVVVVVYGIMVSAESNEKTECPIVSLPLVDDIPVILNGMNRTEEMIKELEEECKELNKEVKAMKQVIADMTEDMLLLSQAITE